jgi:DNA-binding SARP family transcriptional activator
VKSDPAGAPTAAVRDRVFGDARLWRQLMNELPDGIMVVDAAGEVLVANHALHAMTERNEVPGATCCELFGCLVPGSELEKVCLTQHCLAQGPLAEVRVELPPGRPSGAVWISATALQGTPPRVLFRVRRPEGSSPAAYLGMDSVVGPRLGVLSLGRTRLDTPTGPVVNGWLDQRVGRLLKYLVCERHRVVQVDEIAESLWPGSEERGPSIVRHHIHGLRNALEPWRLKRAPSSFIILVPPGGYTIDRNVVRVDADVFERLVTRGLAAEHERSSEAIDTLQRALAWYRGDFLAELPYEVWTLGERERLRDLALRALRALGRLLERRGDLEEAAGYLQQAATMQPFDTDLERELISLAVRSGRRSVAIRRYAALRARMLRQFGDEPDFDLGDLIRTAAAS